MNFLLIAVFLALGSLASRRQWHPSQTSRHLNRYVIWICLPAVVLVTVPQLEMNSGLLSVILIPWLMMLAAGGLVLAVSYFFAWNRLQTGWGLMVTCFGNTSFFGLPVVQAFFGEAGVPYAVVYDQLGSFLGLAILGNIILAIFAKGDRQATSSAMRVWEITRKVLAFPPFVALSVAFVVGNAWMPPWLFAGLAWVSKTLVPSTMFLVGIHLKFRIDLEIRKPLAMALTIKLIMLPGIALLAIAALTPPSLAAQVSVIEAAMPPMVTASVMAIHANLMPRLAAAAVGYGLLFSLLTLPVWYFLAALVS